MALATSVDTHPAVERASGAGVVVPDDISELLAGFATKDDAGRVLAGIPSVGERGFLGVWDAPGLGWREGVAWHLEVGPGVIAVRRRDYARAERAVERLRAREAALHDESDESCRCSLHHALEHGPACEDCEHPSCRLIRHKGWVLRDRITSWSRKSRANMTRTLASLDFGPMLEAGVPALVTLTYPGEWLAVAPSAEVTQRHLRLLRQRYRRKYGTPLIGTWKREFQDRGAPHFHILMVPPAGFGAWLASTWASIVGAVSCGSVQPVWGRVNGKSRIVCCERHRHIAAGTDVDVREGTRYLDPVRVGVYFSKHGSYADKEYQNEAPAEWLADEGAGIGRFWGYWGLEKALVAREVDADTAEYVLRLLRRHHRAQGHTMRKTVWRKVTWEAVDTTTGELVTKWKWRKRRTTVRVKRLGGRSGFILANDGPGLVLAVSRTWDRPRSSFAAWSARC